MHSEPCVGRCLFAIMAILMVSKTISSEVDFRIMTYWRVATIPPEIDVFYLMTSRRRSRIQCFSQCLDKQSQCIGIIYYKTQLLCRLLTADVTEDIVFEEELEPGMVALKKIYVCEYGFHFYNGHCYGLGEFKMTWTDSKIECQEIGAYLTEVETKDENTWLTTTFLPPAADTAECPDAWACSSWIGAERLNASEFFWNRHGNIVTNAPWYPGEPDTRECVHLLRSALWDDDFCDIPRHYICEKDIDEV